MTLRWLWNPKTLYAIMDQGDRPLKNFVGFLWRAIEEGTYFMEFNILAVRICASIYLVSYQLFAGKILNTYTDREI